MKLFFSALLALSFAGATTYAQSTMPAMGANTPKGEVAKTDASINQVAAGKRIDDASKIKTTTKRMRKTNMKTSKPTNNM